MPAWALLRTGLTGLYLHKEGESGMKGPAHHYGGGYRPRAVG